MNTKIYDYLKEYEASGKMRCHMPGHKGRSLSDYPELQKIYALDITEIKGADSLFEADGIISESEEKMAELYGTAATLYSAGGSTSCIQAMLGAMKAENRKVFAIRNVHRAFLNSCVLLGIDAEWIMPDYTSGILSGTVRPEAVEEALKGTENACLYVTSPDYTGRIADIASLAEICHKYGAVLIVDNAHGAHLNFMNDSSHPIFLGADMCCDSAHKMLPALTGAAMLHMRDKKYKNVLREYMSIFTSTSPSYLILMSLDICTDYISKRIRKDISAILPEIKKFRDHFSKKLSFAESEPFHITINAAESGYDGIEFAEFLRENGCECEYADSQIVILLLSPVTTVSELTEMKNIIEKVLEAVEKKERKIIKAMPELPKKVMGIREAAFSTMEEVNVENSLGRICAAVKVPCPPAVPIAASGEVIDENCINIFKNYGISSVFVVK